jgi:YD repeat-containing protein
VPQFMLRFSVRLCAILIFGCGLAYTQTPTITSVMPNPMGIGQSVTISGSNFGSSGSVTFSGLTATTSAWNATSVIATVPVGATNGNIIVTSGGHSSAGYPYTLNNGPVSYVYDDLGRLAAVIDVNGNAAEYQYDPVGNILSISRFNANQVSVINFSPESGPISTPVTINGTGFSTAPSQNTVKFNGTTATVTSATNNQLLVSVPAGSTTGTISVTSLNGSATSTSNFTVTATNGVPTITSFSPASGVAGTTINLLGTNFDPTLANDELRLNATLAVVSSVSPTTMATKVPAATASGYFTLLTPAGNAVSQDFYVPFGTHVPGDIGFTARIPSSGGSQAVTLAAGKIALVLFDGVEGQTINLNETASSISPCSLYLIAPDATTVANINCAGDNSIGPSVLNKTGTYSIGIDPGTASGSLMLSLSKDYIGQLTVPAPGTAGTAITVPASGDLGPGQNAILSFSVGAGQKISINLPSSTIGSSYTSCRLTLYDQSRTQIITSGWCGSGAPTYIDTVTLAAETYSVVIAPSGTALGHLTISLNNDADVMTPAIAIGNASAQWSTTVAGQDVRLTFTPNSSQTQVAIEATDLSNMGQATVNLVAPSGSTQASMSISPGTQTFFMDTQPVTPSQPYQLWVQHSGSNLESQTLQILNVPSNFTGALTVPAAGLKGTAVQVPTTGSLAVGQNATLTFSASAAQQLSFNVVGSTIGNAYTDCNLKVTGPNPSTTQITFGYCGKSGPGYVDTVTIPTTGTYTVLIDPQGLAVGNVGVSINNDQDVITPTIAIGGSAVTAKTTVAGQDVRLSFTPTASQPRVAILATNVTNPSATLNLWTGTSTQASTSINNSPSGQTFFIDTQAVNASQQYQLWVSHSSTNFGNETLQIKNVPADISHTVTVGGTAYAFSTVIGQNANIKFSISSSEAVTVHWTSGTYPSTLNCYMRVTGPSPSTNQVGFGNCNTATGTVSLGTIASGTYNILVDPQAQSAGGMSLTVTTP